MAETIGALVDRLSVVNLKMWWKQEGLYAVRKMDFSQFKEKYGTEEGLREIYDIFKDATDLNCQRNDLIDELDRRLDGAIKAGAAPIQNSHKSY